MSIAFRAKHKTGFWVDAPLHPFNFPAGEAHIKIDEGFKPEDYTHFVADIRGQDPQDLFHLAMWENVLTGLGAEGEKIVFLPYLPAARADRGLPFGADVYGEFVSNLFLDRVVALDPHSDVVLKKYWNHNKSIGRGNILSVIPFGHVIKMFIQDATSDSRSQPYDGVIAPDKGAVGRAQKAADAMGVPVYTAGKTRDFETGALTGFHMEDELPAEGHFLIVDDICDGGGTFVGLADAIQATNPDVKLSLWVSHGIFSKGFNFATKFETVHTTNSYFMGSLLLTGEYAGSYFVPKNIKLHDITPFLYTEVSVND